MIFVLFVSCVKDLRAHSDSLCSRTLTITAATLTPLASCQVRAVFSHQTSTINVRAYYSVTSVDLCLFTSLALSRTSTKFCRLLELPLPPNSILYLEWRTQRNIVQTYIRDHRLDSVWSVPSVDPRAKPGHSRTTSITSRRGHVTSQPPFLSCVWGANSNVLCVTNDPEWLRLFYNWLLSALF